MKLDRLDPDDVESFTKQFVGQVIGPGDDGYEEHRRVWNGMIDKHPALIARCRSRDDVVRAVNFARDRGLLLAVRGGGHSFAGFSTCDGGVVLDLSNMQAVVVNADRQVARAEGGVTWGVFDAATHAHGLASTGGLISTTGIAGLTLGGGIGWLQRKYGLACDNLLLVELVTASGEIIRASEAENRELFWGLRGGGGNFGVVTSFEFRLHTVSSVVGGLLLFPAGRAAEVMRFYRDYVRSCPDELTTWLSAITAPAADFVPEDLHGKAALAVLACHCGDPADAERALRPLRALGPAADLIESMPYPQPLAPSTSTTWAAPSPGSPTMPPPSGTGDQRSASTSWGSGTIPPMTASTATGYVRSPQRWSPSEPAASMSTSPPNPAP